MDQPDLTDAPWRKSTYSGGPGTDCVEIAPTPDRVAIRDSKNRTGGTLIVTQMTWKRLMREFQ